ncbi:hypothetical protein C8R47DRAFT_1066551 [Mycena vitilis]|nr:hypothetical protein C8R47DRAFT_1066551 [Mycena vitilis]
MAEIIQDLSDDEDIAKLLADYDSPATEDAQMQQAIFECLKDPKAKCLGAERRAGPSKLKLGAVIVEVAEDGQEIPGSPEHIKRVGPTSGKARYLREEVWNQEAIWLMVRDFGSTACMYAPQLAKTKGDGDESIRGGVAAASLTSTISQGSQSGYTTHPPISNASTVGVIASSYYFFVRRRRRKLLHPRERKGRLISLDCESVDNCENGHLSEDTHAPAMLGPSSTWTF